MKKLIGIVGVAVIAMAMFFSTSALNSSSGDLDLASLLNINTANAESGTYKGPLCSNQSGTIYCCKGSEGSCSAGAKCSSCT